MLVVCYCTNNTSYIGSMRQGIGDAGNRLFFSGCKIARQRNIDTAIQIRMGPVNSGINYANQNRGATGCSIPCLGKLDFINGPLVEPIRIIRLCNKGVDYIIRSGVDYIRMLNDFRNGVKNILLAFFLQRQAKNLTKFTCIYIMESLGNDYILFLGSCSSPLSNGIISS